MTRILQFQIEKQQTLLPFIYRRFFYLLKSFRKQVLYVYISFLVASVVLFSLYSKRALHLEMNKFHSVFFDTFFKNITYLGDGIMFGVFSVFFLFIKRRRALPFVLGGVLTLLITHFFKKILYRDVARPIELLGSENLYLIQGVKMAHWNSFPSGHTITAFALFTILCSFFTRCKSQYLWALLAIIAGLSRVYLSQHFLMDIFVGSFIGIIIGLISAGVFYKVKRVH